MARPDPDPLARDAEIEVALAACGLIPRGWFALEEGEAPGFRSALLVGQAGASTWPDVEVWLAAQPAHVDHPIDEWTRVVLGEIATAFGARAAFTFERPYHPFQRWAKRAERLKPSPLGILMHPEYGLWHAYRGALLFEAAIAAPVVSEPIHLCDLCVGKPCLSSCPAGAWSQAAFARDACIGHLQSPRGDACMSGGCLARNACPEGARYRYPPQVQAHHQAYFRDGRHQA